MDHGGCFRPEHLAGDAQLLSREKNLTVAAGDPTPRAAPRSAATLRTEVCDQKKVVVRKPSLLVPVAVVLFAGVVAMEGLS